jgi:hypothetical protein
MEEVVCGGALSGARHRGDPARRKSPSVGGGRLLGQRGAPRRCGTRGGVGGDGLAQRPLVIDVGFGGSSRWSSASGRPPAVDGGGSSAGEGWGIDGDLMVVPVRLEEGWSGLLPEASLPQLDRAPACSPSGWQLTLLTKEEVEGVDR